MITRVPHTVRTTTGVGPWLAAGATAAPRCGRVKLLPGITAATTMPVPDMVRDLCGATRMMKAIMTTAVLLMTATPLRMARPAGLITPVATMIKITCGATRILTTTGTTVANHVSDSWFTMCVIMTKVGLGKFDCDCTLSSY